VQELSEPIWQNFSGRKITTITLIDGNKDLPCHQYTTTPTYLPISATAFTPKDLTEAGATNADLYIGVTP
jgi:hypothetical protein